MTRENTLNGDDLELPPIDDDKQVEEIKSVLTQHFFVDDELLGELGYSNADSHVLSDDDLLGKHGYSEDANTTHSHSENGGYDAKEKCFREMTQLESEYKTIKHKLKNMRKKIRKMGYDNIPTEDHHLASPLPTALPNRKNRRRWSLSSVHDPKIGAALMIRNGGGDGTGVMFYDELDYPESGHSMRHRHSNLHHHLPNYNTDLLKKVNDNDSEDLFSSSMMDDTNSEHSETMSLVPRSPRSNTREEKFWDDLKDRASWLVGLMVLQSMSSFIIKRNEVLLQDHIIIVQFLTMLVGAGGNAGNQASVRVIRGLAVGAVTDRNSKAFLMKELSAGVVLACILGVSGGIRAIVFATPIPETTAITLSLWCIVFISIATGAILPMGMKKVGIDPAHSSTSIQVIMDITGVAITVNICQLILS